MVCSISIPNQDSKKPTTCSLLVSPNFLLLVGWPTVEKWSRERLLELSQNLAIKEACMPIEHIENIKPELTAVVAHLGAFNTGAHVVRDMLGAPACEVRERLEPKPVTLPHETTPWLCPESMHWAELLLHDTPATKKSRFTKKQRQAFAYQLARPNSVVRVKFSAEQVQSMNVCALTYKAPRATAPNTWKLENQTVTELRTNLSKIHKKRQNWDGQSKVPDLFW